MIVYISGKKHIKIQRVCNTLSETSSHLIKVRKIMIYKEVIAEA